MLKVYYKNWVEIDYIMCRTREEVPNDFFYIVNFDENGKTNRTTNWED